MHMKETTLRTVEIQSNGDQHAVYEHATIRAGGASIALKGKSLREVRTKGTSDTQMFLRISTSAEARSLMDVLRTVDRVLQDEERAAQSKTMPPLYPQQSE